MPSSSSSMGSRWRDAGIRIADRLFQYRFVQQFAALFYKNGERSRRWCWRVHLQVVHGVLCMYAALH
jgi:hypothetical protein